MGQEHQQQQPIYFNNDEQQNLINNNNNNNNNNSYYNHNNISTPPPPPTSITSTTSTGIPIIGANKNRYNNNPTINYNNHGNKIMIPRDPISGDFCSAIPIQIQPFISPNDYCEIINQINFYKSGVRVPFLYYITSSIVCLVILGFIVFINISVSLAGFALIPALIIVVVIHIYSFLRSKRIFKRETERYISVINQTYTNLTFHPTYCYKSELIKQLDIYFSNTVQLNNTIPSTSMSREYVSPPNIYSQDIFRDFKYLRYIKPVYIDKQVSYYNSLPSSSLSTIETIDISNDQSQVPQYITPSPQQQKQQKLEQEQPTQIYQGRTQIYINNTSYYADDIKRPSIQDLLSPSDAESFYTNPQQNNDNDSNDNKNNNNISYL
ncbi:hypothetical protein DICPUDRAFT_79115 [Dictyostelium purpureum]|uniref:Uncharacterized protein n=1 Tax=Dictyostelium purpureum TaxID=5786 RepID=F0ZLL7_DICPU|nr:uncharacterized protein DICPUDRAFT_79115 [Dictyostelium purpureum]EGC35177.1 hypothetical protein DICPUDRAFT_79115 [Dictyostelium purpureum]|eukprot:XP_003288315.1 hypothetical protein DICPUDRAFT_79115 [Dictyostelium purpureum]